MHHDLALVSTMVVSLVYALVGGYIASRLHLPPLLGYLIAGVAVGPFTPGFVADARLAPQLAEIGVILLMFGVGMHFSVRDLLAVGNIAIPGALVQIAVAVALTCVVAHSWGWHFGPGLILGLALSVASTVVLLRVLEAEGILESPIGRLAVGWLIVEDLVTVVILVMLPALASSLGGETGAGHPAQGNDAMQIFAVLGIVLAKFIGFVVLMLVVGSRLLPWFLERVAATGSRELFTLAVIAVALGRITAIGRPKR
jgi:CPA2 family monovalent cation:H+ antiporter-2